MKNKLIVIGWMGIKVCYLNVSKEEAIRRCTESGVMDSDELEENPDVIKEIEFDDMFYAYDVWEDN